MSCLHFLGLSEYKDMTEEGLLKELDGPHTDTYFRNLIEEKFEFKDKDLKDLTEEVLLEVERRKQLIEPNESGLKRFDETEEHAELRRRHGQERWLRNQGEVEAEEEAWVESDEFRRFREYHTKAVATANSMEKNPNICERMQNIEWGKEYARVMLEVLVPGNHSIVCNL